MVSLQCLCENGCIFYILPCGSVHHQCNSDNPGAPIALSYFWFLCNVLCPSLYMLVPSGLTSLLHPQKRLQIIMMTKPREFVLYFENYCFALHEGTSCLSLGSPGNHFPSSCHQIRIQQGHLEDHLGWELLPFTTPAGLLCAEVRRLCMRWFHDHYSDRGYLNIL